MSNKTDLQANNARIEAFIADGQDLPPALPDELGNATTADVLSGKTFTSDDGVMQTGGLAPNGFGSAIATDVLIGKTFSSATGIFQNGGLDPETLKNGQYVWKELTAEGGTFRKYVVSDTESAYPDGGEQDGYWYENALKTPEQIIAPLFGMSKASFGTMMLSSHQTTQHDLVHNLGAIPKLVFLFTPEHLYALPNYIKSATIVDGYTQYDGYGTNYYFMNYLVQSSSNSSEEAFSNLDSAVPASRATTTTIPLGDSDFIYFAQGRTYYWVAMA